MKKYNSYSILKNQDIKIDVESIKRNYSNKTFLNVSNQRILHNKNRAKSNWKKTKNMFNAVFYLLNPKINIINDVNNLNKEVKISQIYLEKKPEDTKYKKSKDKFKIDSLNQFEKIELWKKNQKKTDYFCGLCSIGGKKQIEKLKEILKNDMSNFFYEKNHENYILNKKNSNEETPLYISIKNGNFKLFKFLLKNGANWKIWVNNESILEISVRWNFFIIIKYILTNKYYTNNDLKNSIKKTKNINIKNHLNKYIKKKKLFLF